MALTKCKYCEDQHICHRVGEGWESSGQLLYEAIKDYLNENWPAWDNLPREQQDNWTSIANR
jgi:hypothetical protein